MTTPSAGKRVLFVSNDPPGAAVYRYRCENLASLLRADGWHTDVAWIGDRQVRVDHDVVVLHRICAVSEGRAVARAARACGATLVYGADDLVFEADAFPDKADARKRRFAPLHAAMARDADAVLVSTDYLAERARAVVGPDKPILVVRNFLAHELERLSAAACCLRAESGETRDYVTIGYGSGTPTHDADLATIAEPLAQCLRDYPNARLTLIGPVTPPPALVAAAGDRLDRQPLVDWKTLPEVLADFDINLAPLDLSRPFNHAKSEIKLLEAGAAGVPTIASASAGFREALAVSRRPGALLAETADDWRRHLTTLVGDAEARRAARVKAVMFTNAHGRESAHRATICAAFARLASLPHAAPAAKQATTVGRSPFAPKTLARRALGLLRPSA